MPALLKNATFIYGGQQNCCIEIFLLLIDFFISGAFMSVLPHSRAGNSEQWRALNRVIQEKWYRGLLCCHADMQEGEGKKDPGAKGGRGYAGVEWEQPRASFPEKGGMPIFSCDHEAWRSFVQWSVRRRCADGNINVCDQSSPLQRTGGFFKWSILCVLYGNHSDGLMMIYSFASVAMAFPCAETLEVFSITRRWMETCSHFKRRSMQEGQIQKPNNNSASFWCVFL